MALFVFLLISCSVATVSAIELGFEAASVSCKRNRIVKVGVFCTGIENLRGCAFEFTYDSGILDYRGVEKDKSIIIRENSMQGRVKLALLVKKDYSCGSSPLFYLKFKSLNYGSTPIDFTVSECVDKTPAYASVGACVSGNVTVENSGSARSAARTSASSKASSRASSKTSSKAKSSAASGSSTSKGSVRRSSSGAASSGTAETSADDGEDDIEDIIGYEAMQKASKAQLDFYLLMIIAAIAVLVLTFIIFLLVFKVRKLKSRTDLLPEPPEPDIPEPKFDEEEEYE